MTDPKPEDKSVWGTTAKLLQRLETDKFYGTVELKMEAGEPVYARVTEGIKL